MIMGGLRKIVMAVVIAAASMGSAGAVVLATATPSGASQPSCTDSWQGPATGTTNWNASAANWTAGFPTSSSVVCVSEAGTYTVVFTTSETVNTLEVGGATSGTQTVLNNSTGSSVTLTLGAASFVNNGGVLTEESGTSGNANTNGGSGSITVASGGTFSTTGTSNTAVLQVPVTNLAGGTVTMGATSTEQNNGTLTSNQGTFGVPVGSDYALSGSSNFTNSAGTLTVNGTLSENSGTFTQSGGTVAGTNPVDLTGGTLADSAGTGSIAVTGSINLTGTIPAGQTVTNNSSGSSVTITLPGAVTVDGSFIEESGTAGNANTNGGSGSLTVASGGVFSTEGTTNTAFLQVPVTNETGGTVTMGAASTAQNNGTLTSNQGTFSVPTGGNYALSGSSNFTDSAGTLTVNGTLTENSGTFTQSGATVSGSNPVDLTGGTLADSAGTGSFEATGSIDLSGTIPAGQTVTNNSTTSSVTITLPGAVTVDGTFIEDSGTSGNANTNGSSGSITVASGGKFTTGGTVNNAFLQVPVTNQTGGTVTMGAVSTQQDNGTLTSNQGTFSVPTGGNYALSGSSNFTNSAGTLTVNGTLTENSGTFTQSGGTESGSNPVDLTGGTLADSAGTGSFEATGSIDLSGTIPAGQTVTNNSTASSVTVTLPSAVTVDGTLIEESGASGNANINGSSGSITVASGGAFSTEGSANNAFLQVPVTNQAGGTVTIGAHSTAQNNTTADSNSGTWQVANGGELTLSGSSTLVNHASGTLGVTVNGTAGTGGISGPGVTVTGSTLGVTTVGSQPTAGTMFTPIGGPVTGTFSTYVFGANAYAVTYPSGAVVLTAENPFTVTPTAFTPLENESTVTPQVATLGNANDDSGIYSATVNYGDGSGNQTATVATSGATGTVTGPSHTYTTNGTYTVTVTVANTNGTTITTTENVTVAGPVITGFSKTSVKQGRKLTTKVSGTGFDTSANTPTAWTTSNPGITILSAKLGKPSKKRPNPTITLKLKVSATAATGPVNVTLTEDTGTYTFPNAITVIS